MCQIWRGRLRSAIVEYSHRHRRFGGKLREKMMTKDLQNVWFWRNSPCFLIPTVMVGGCSSRLWLAWSQEVHELLKMKGLETARLLKERTVSGLRPDFADRGLPPLLQQMAHDCLMVWLSWSLMGTTVLLRITIMKMWSIPLPLAFYVGLGFHSLVDARIAGIDKVLLALIVWATDSGAYLVGSRFGKRKLMPGFS